MISKEENERLCLVHPGTDMGEVFRRYWIPFALAGELGEPDGPPIRVRLLGEDLVAFRDSTGAVGLVDAFCSHRRAPLFYGRNEECGLRCVYHGWKFDRTGACVDLPTEPPTSRFREHVGITAYPTWEGGGLVWTYMGPAGSAPPPPDYEWMRVPPSHFRISKTVEACNFLQAVEGGIDTAHSSYLHNLDITNPNQLRVLDGHPKLEVDYTDYGYSYASLRRIGGGRVYLRVYQFVMPFQQMRAGLIDFYGNPSTMPSIGGHVWVPIDDFNTAVFNWAYAPDRDSPISDEQWDAYERKFGRGPDDFIPGTYRLRRNATNDYLIDREVQKYKTFTGIEGINTQDYAIQEGMGVICDRTREHPGTTDRAVLAARRLLLEAADWVKAGKPLKGTDPAACRGVRASETVTDEGVPWLEAIGSGIRATW
ncbi:MAG TPA: Rieske 2Fe-2S domain-containing protein [Acidimicrobiales bacterium]|nr:Rieske 2Fe-2S domain-containing protein [Acidimicrobiales bacterium]